MLLLEDDINLSDTIAEYLEDEGFEVHRAYTSDEAIDLVYEMDFDILLLDVMVPGMDGFKLLQKIRQKSDTPAIFITSLDSVESVEKGYESGCDDYIRKPFALKELKLRIQTLLKRTFEAKESRVQIDTNTYFDLATNTLYKNNKPVTLNQKEIRLLRLFLKHRGEPLSHEKIYETLWDYEETPSDMALRTYIKNLRKILGKEKIESIKRYGYKFNK